MPILIMNYYFRGDGKDEGDLRIVEDDEDEDSNCDDKFKEAQEKIEVRIITLKIHKES
ncbi:MAG: hypothetical protein GY696_19280, partial [Gammaproteobacteria bacterium]|nr:hypothetical protein [Gammaproteobacteria bacterium]